MNKIHSTAVIGQNAVIGDNNIIGPYCIIDNCSIGDNNVFSAHVSIGQEAQHKKYKSSFKIEIGNWNTFREFSTVHCGTMRETRIGNRNYLMAYSHVAHDCVLQDDITMANSSQLGGHCFIMDGVNLGLGSLVHQYQVLGAYSMLGMGAVVTKKLDIYPGEVWVGNPAEFLKKNEIGLDRFNITDDQLLFYERSFRTIKCSQS